MSETKSKNKHAVIGVEPDSIASDLGIKEGYFLTSINGVKIKDVFDYKTAVCSENLTLGIETDFGEILEFDIEKDEDEDIGLVFENYLMDRNIACKNKCIFCFVDQLPRNLRKSLYFKDDDIRLSFLSGNYITLTNVSDEELDRIISYRLSPVNISVHTTDPELRIKMMNNKDAGKLMDQLKRIVDADLDINCQIVLCPQVNDGKELENTIKDLFDLGEKIQSISIVPVGLTKYRGKNKLYPILPLGSFGAKSVIQTVTNWQQIFLGKRGKRVIFASDEIYIKAQSDIPETLYYDDFPQLENGVGMTSLFIEEMKSGLDERKLKLHSKSSRENNFDVDDAGYVFLVTGKDAAPFISKFQNDLQAVYKRKFITKCIMNEFFGENVTVAGLVTGNDIIRTLSEDKNLQSCELIVIPGCMLRSGEEVFLDDISLSDIKGILNKNIVCVDPVARGLLEEMDKQYKI